MMRNSAVAEGDIQVIIPYELHRRLVLFIRAHHRSLTVEELIVQVLDSYLQRQEAP
jgi:hypothetical protein